MSVFGRSFEPSAGLKGLAAALLVSAGIALAAFPISAADRSGPVAGKCAALLDIDLPDTVVQSAVEAGDGASRYCRVRGYIRPQINFELHLPIDGWNGKFYMAGCGGYCGRLEPGTSPTSPFNLGAGRHYATILTDTGHWGVTSNDNRWAAANPVALDDFYFRHIPAVAQVGKALTRTYYGTTIRYSYFNGCSGGGKQGVTAATRFPDEFDGIIAGAPALDPGALFAQYTWVSSIARSGAFDPAKLPLLRGAVAKACGDETGLLLDPLSCKFDPQTLQCPAGGSGASCLTPGEVDAARKFYASPRIGNGPTLMAGGAAYGSEPFWALPDRTKLFAFHGESSKGIVRFGVYPEPIDRPADLARDYAQVRARTEYLRSATDYSKFAARKGKIIFYEGLGDLLVPPALIADYYNRASHQLGATADDTMRLFMVPGLGHCRNAPGSNSPGFNDGEFDVLTALEAWVERGQAPQQIIATRQAAALAERRSLPLCPYPAVPRFTGSGDRRDAANWRCVAPGAS